MVSRSISRISGLALTAIGLLSLCAAQSVCAQSITIGAPGDPGDGNSFPFGSSAGTRYQQVYNSNLFSGPISIDVITFFNTQFQPGSAVIDTATYDIHLSTTSKPVNGLDTSNLNANVGPDDALFFDGTLGGPIGPTKELDILGGPFTYDPSQGNLLIDITKSNDQGNGNAYLDARNGDFGSMSSRAHNFGSGFEGWGLVTEFTYGPVNPSVPEPSTLALLLGMGSSGSLLACRRLRRRRQA